MSKGKIGFLEVAGLCVSVISLLAGIFQISNHQRDVTNPHSLLTPESLPAVGRVVKPSAFENLLDYNWLDPLPFDSTALRKADISSIGMDRYLLENGEDTLESSLQLSEGHGTRFAFLSLSLAADKVHLQQMIRKELAVGGRSFYSESHFTELHADPGYPDFHSIITKDGQTSRSESRWVVVDGKPWRLDGDDGRPLRQYQQDVDADAVLLRDASGHWSISIWVKDQHLSQSKLVEKALSVKGSLLRQAMLGTVSDLETRAHLGVPDSTRMTVLLDGRDQVIGLWHHAYDSLGRPEKYEFSDGKNSIPSKSVLFEYDANGNLRQWVDSAATQKTRREIQYSHSGWPMRIAEWIEYPSGSLKILSINYLKYNK